MITKEQFDKEINKDLTLIDFYATWCGPCKMLSPVLEKLKDKYNIVKVDIDQNEELTSQFNVMVVPTLILFKQGKEVNQISGFLTEKEVINWIENNK